MNLVIDNVYLLKAEREVIEKINDESFPLYDGLSNEEARNTILSEYEKVEKLAKKLAKVNVSLLKNPIIYSQYIDRRMLFGMENAIDWALKNLEIKEEWSRAWAPKLHIVNWITCKKYYCLQSTW